MFRNLNHPLIVLTVTMESVILRVICIVIFNFLYAMVFWSYFQTVMTDVGRVPRDVSYYPFICVQLI